MDFSTRLRRAPKGEDEVKDRRYQLSIRRRSVLVQLEKPQTVEFLLDRTVFHEDEIMYELEALLQDGFVVLDTNAAEAASKTAQEPDDIYRLHADIVLSKARFLLIDFCVDSFGTQSETLASDIRACRNAEQLSQCVRSISAAAETQCPDRLPELAQLISKINATA